MTKSLAELPLIPPRLTSSLPHDLMTPPDQPMTELVMRQPRPVRNAAFSYVMPEKAPRPHILSVSNAALKELDLDPEAVKSQQYLEVFSGNIILPNTNPWSLCYAGHQFGYFAGQLGDGRAISLFETENKSGKRWELQLKGAGRTPYSRFADGYAVLRSSIREYLGSEHMAALGVPTTRALNLILTDREVYRDDAPSNVPQPEQGAIVTRMAPSWLRIGNFEIFHSRKDKENVKKLADYVLKEVIKIDQVSSENKGNRYENLLREVARSTAEMVAGWQSIGFNHGVMNTDNMSLLGLTIDYGPYQFMDYYDHQYICNHSDHGGRYAFSQQPTVCMWNVYKLGVTLVELIGAGEEVDEVDITKMEDGEKLQQYRKAGEEIVNNIAGEELGEYFMKYFTDKMRAKLGLTTSDSSDMENVIGPLLHWMGEYKIDYHKFIRSLSDYQIAEDGEEKDADNAIEKLHIISGLKKEDKAKEDLKPWLSIYRHRILLSNLDNEGRKKKMDSVNPRFVLRNWIAQEVCAAFDEKHEDEASTMLESCLQACTNPFQSKFDDEQIEKWIQQDVPQWGRDLKCSCSS
ncbi:hypothetical protein NQZ79_g8606 [Umbelopsis isabellina]|nr:hypothetical protein NQZ79_g8606 [Umbelopsis isabellina]